MPKETAALLSAPTASLHAASPPEVSIIVLNYNRSDLTAQCLRHVFDNTSGRRYEVIVVDNGSEPVDLKKVAELQYDFQLVRLPVNRCFGGGNNIGVEASRGKFIVFLNNDAFVTVGWLEPLIDVLENQFAAGGVGPRLLYPDGRLQEAGAFVDGDGFSFQRGKKFPISSEELESVSIVDYCSAACFATTREIFDRVFGFDAMYAPAYYEDTDLCFKIASLGRFIYYCPTSVVHHVENATWASFPQALRSVVETNRQKFLARWGDYLRAREAGEDAFPWPSSGKHKPGSVS